MGDPVNEQISDALFQYYSDYFAYAAIAGIKSAKAIRNVLNTAINADTSTFTLVNTAFASRNTMVRTLESAYDIVYENANNLEPMRGAFSELANHIRKFTGLDIDDYLTAQGIQVEQIYANISALTGETISDSNIK